MYVVSALGCAFCWNLESFYVFRFIGGLAIGASSVLAPVYISEIAPADRRGALTGLFQFNIVFGILLALREQCARAVDSRRRGPRGAGSSAWPRCRRSCSSLLMYTIPQSPRWLALRGRDGEAKASLERVGVTDTGAHARASSSARRRRARRNAAQKLFVAAYRRPIVLAILLAMFNQLSGINAILYYLNDIFAAAGFSGLSNDLQAVAIGAANLIATMIALRVIDRVGRKKLLLIGAVGTAVALAGVAVIMGTGRATDTCCAMLIMFIAFFAFSQGAVIWVYLARFFRPRCARAARRWAAPRTGA